MPESLTQFRHSDGFTAWYFPPTDLSAFHRISIAKCAMERAQENVFNNDRWMGEFKTATMWIK
jgi:hypothetical protein